MADERLPVATGLCKDCRFWFNGLSDFSDIAECRRMPPARSEKYLIGTLGGGLQAGAAMRMPGKREWPMTEFMDSCGEYSPRDPGIPFVWDMGK